MSRKKTTTVLTGFMSDKIKKRTCPKLSFKFL